MKENEIKEELELCIRCFLEAKERAGKQGIDSFDELRILEASFNRLFMAVEHLCNALVLLEKGNYSKKHFGDFSKLKELGVKYRTDIAELYQISYSFRAYADYRKFPEIKDKFRRDELKMQINNAEKAIKACLGEIGKVINIEEFGKRLFASSNKK